jgi:hypothetical protein
MSLKKVKIDVKLSTDNNKSIMKVYNLDNQWIATIPLYVYDNLSNQYQPYIIIPNKKLYIKHKETKARKLIIDIEGLKREIMYPEWLSITTEWYKSKIVKEYK